MDEQLQLLSPEARQAIIEGMTLEQKAENRYLPDYLSIREISDLKHPIRSFKPPDNLDRKERQDWRLQWKIEKAANEKHKNDLLAACEAGLLQYEGDIKGWEYFGTNPHHLARKGNGEIFIPDPSKSFYYDTRYDLGIPRPVKYKCPPDYCTIHKDEFKRYLQSREQWPVNGLLANWWTDNEEPQQTDTPMPETQELTNHPTLKGKVEEIGLEVLNTYFRGTPSRFKGYLRLIWERYQDEPNAETFLKRLIADGFINDFDNPIYDRDIAPIYKIVPSKGIWATYEEDSKPHDPRLKLITIQNNCSAKWVSSSKKKSK